jgi:hypothetical protein
MKKVFFSGLAILALCTGKLNAQVDDIINKHLTAIGGEAAVKAVTSLKVEGNLNAQGFDLPFTKTVIQGKGFKQVISVMGTDGYVLARVDSGWNFMPFMGQSEPVVMAPDELKQWSDELDAVSNFVDYKTKGHTAVAVDAITIEGKQCPGVLLTFKNGYKKTFYFDPATWYILRTVCTKVIQGSETEMQIDYSGYEKLPEGVFIAKKISGESATYTINKVIVNSAGDGGILAASK